MKNRGNSVLSDHERQRIRAARLAKGYTQQGLADKIHYARSTIEAVENGRKNPSLNFLQVLCKALDIDINGLFDSED